MFLAGKHEGKLKNFGPVLPVGCIDCNSGNFWNSYQQVMWFTAYGICLFPIQNRIFLKCTICSKRIFLNKKEVKSVRKFMKMTVDWKNKKITKEVLIDQIKLSGLVERANSVINNNINCSKEAKWTEENQRLAIAIEDSIYKPHNSADKIKALLENGININAKNSDNFTALRLAKYYEVPLGIKLMLESAGAIE